MDAFGEPLGYNSEEEESTDYKPFASVPHSAPK